MLMDWHSTGAIALCDGGTLDGVGVHDMCLLLYGFSLTDQVAVLLVPCLRTLPWKPHRTHITLASVVFFRAVLSASESAARFLSRSCHPCRISLSSLSLSSVLAFEPLHVASLDTVSAEMDHSQGLCSRNPKFLISTLPSFSTHPADSSVQALIRHLTMTVNMGATVEQKRTFLRSLRRSLGQLGLDIVHPFAAQSYNATELGQKNPMHTFGQSSTLSFVVGSHKSFWEPFLHQHYPSKFQSEAEAKDPMDHYCERLIPQVTLQALKDANLYSENEGQEHTTAFSVAFSHWRITVPHAGTPPEGSKPTGFVAPPVNTLPIQHVAHAAGFAYFNPIAFLNVHPVYGPWFGMRAIVMVDLPYDLSDNELLLITDENQTGTYSRDSKPIENNPAFERLTPKEIEAQNAALELTKTALLTKGWDARDWKEWVAFRQSLAKDRPDWQKWRYSDDQMRYHYQKESEFLAMCAESLQAEQKSDC